MGFILFDNVKDVVLDVGFVLFVNLHKHLLKLMETDKLMSSVELVDACEATKSAGLALFVQANHENFLVVAKV